jgi:hypothetical protein
MSFQTVGVCLKERKDGAELAQKGKNIFMEATLKKKKIQSAGASWSGRAAAVAQSAVGRAPVSSARRSALSRIGAK